MKLKSDLKIENGQINIEFKRSVDWKAVVFVCVWFSVSLFIPSYSKNQGDPTWETVLTFLFPLMGIFFFYNVVIKLFLKEKISINESYFTNFRPIARKEEVLEMDKITDFRKSIFSKGYFTFMYGKKEGFFGEDISNEDGEEIYKTIMEHFPQISRMEQVSEEDRKLEAEMLE